MQPIRRSYQQLQRFTADASHELRSPLSAILTNAQVGLMLASNDSRFQPPLENIVDSAKSMGALVNNLLLLARHQGKLAPESLKLLPLNPFLAEIVSQFGALADAQGIHLNYEQPEQVIQDWADPDLLRQVIENLLSNACKYTPTGGSVRLRLVPHPGWAVVQVIGGAGMMGLEQAQQLLNQGHTVAIIDIDPLACRVQECRLPFDCFQQGCHLMDFVVRQSAPLPILP